jgi:tetratricopeptide (TPR) repeat protein
MRFVVAWLWLAALVGVAHGGDNKAAARDSYREGTRQYDLGDYQKALELFKRAYLLYEEPSILFNSAQCERQLKHPEEAVKLYKSYLRKVPDAPNRADVEKMIQRLETEIAQQEAERKAPPQGTLTATEKSTAPQPTLIAPSPRTDKTPAYKKWWLWTPIAVAVVGIGLGVGLGVGLSRRETFSPTQPGFGPGEKSMALGAW